ncbi:IS4 family transposase [Pontibacter qinzhouensis]|uniref:IS4 family transposase n=1 Tax=Pontibacter qinzhouensis TaxID=2603253 RepID=A0A5C8K625_9BACT|nr:IS4 family transposase [Pontibacter qinzhouensis]TXK45711.1 IS4 family transposase [Pontibacter qinzhouensis]
MKKYFSTKIKEIFDKVEIVSHLARKKFIFSFVLGLIKSRKVHFCEVAEHLNHKTKAACNEVRIQDFFRQAVLNYEQVAMLLCLFLPRKGKVRLSIDRTEWDFGKCQVNILMVLASHGKIQVPLYWSLLDNKSGNSSTQDRIDVVAKCLHLLGNRIGLLVADREFMGHKWLKYLKDSGINFCVRMPKHHLIERLDGRVQQAQELAKSHPLSLSDCLVDGVWGNVYLKRTAQGDLLYLFGTMEAKHLGTVYRRRWTIEACFQAFKSRGFDLKSTHLKDLEKLKKLVAMVSIAYGLCVSLGIYQDARVKKIKIKKHGYKANSYFRTGLNQIREMLKMKAKDWHQRIEIFIRWLNRQFQYYQNTHFLVG